ncbi:hypothetical protein DERP_011682 [Dermatophagoides pteronyssinus]|uniref:Uncharacterized protein n=1 Tax=Dermatophagoides pteronyssinus TaxID=6956 RepID=A0ABQ8J2Z1_DERPT|nr:hypothetical protein DERP_011682 [Dermatophagoides pteronyssinus]
MENDDQSVKENDNDGDQMKIDRISSDDLSDQSIKRKANEMSENTIMILKQLAMMISIQYPIF